MDFKNSRCRSTLTDMGNTKLQSHGKMSHKKSKRKQNQVNSADSDVSFDEAVSGQFSPVKVPTGKSPAQGNLTGSARKVKDAVADWHNYIQKWSKFNMKGFQLATQISNSKLAVLSDHGEEESNSTHMPEEMEGLVIQMEETFKAMVMVVQKFEKMTEVLKGVSDLEWHQNNQAWSEECLFQTWPTHQFYTTSKEILDMYVKEASLKKTMIENIAHATDRHLLMFYTSSWLHQPYIDGKSELLLESMLHETGHRR